MPVIVSRGAAAIADLIKGAIRSNPRSPMIPAVVFFRNFPLFINQNNNQSLS
jgi:hypothetical protein